MKTNIMLSSLLSSKARFSLPWLLPSNTKTLQSSPALIQPKAEYSSSSQCMGWKVFRDNPEAMSSNKLGPISNYWCMFPKRTIYQPTLVNKSCEKPESIALHRHAHGCLALTNRILCLMKGQSDSSFLLLINTSDLGSMTPNISNTEQVYTTPIFIGYV